MPEAATGAGIRAVLPFMLLPVPAAMTSQRPGSLPLRVYRKSSASLPGSAGSRWCLACRGHAFGHT